MNSPPSEPAAFESGRIAAQSELMPLLLAPNVDAATRRLRTVAAARGMIEEATATLSTIAGSAAVLALFTRLSHAVIQEEAAFRGRQKEQG